MGGCPIDTSHIPGIGQIPSGSCVATSADEELCNIWIRAASCHVCARPCRHGCSEPGYDVNHCLPHQGCVTLNFGQICPLLTLGTEWICASSQLTVWLRITCFTDG